MWVVIILTAIYFIICVIADKKIEDNDKFENLLFILWFLYIISIIIYIIIFGSINL